MSDDGLDLKFGMKEIARYYGLDDRQKAYRLAREGHLAGVYQLGSRWTLDPNVAREGMRKRAEVGVKKEGQ